MALKQLYYKSVYDLRYEIGFVSLSDLVSQTNTEHGDPQVLGFVLG